MVVESKAWAFPSSRNMSVEHFSPGLRHHEEGKLLEDALAAILIRDRECVS